MRVYGFILAVVLLLAAAAWALNTVSPLNDKGGGAGRGWQRRACESRGRTRTGTIPDNSGPVRWHACAGAGCIRPDFPSLRPDRPAGLSARAGQGPVGQSTRDLIDGAGDAVRWGTGHHWSTDPGRYSDVGFLNASSRVDLPAFADVGWANAPLPVASETSHPGDRRSSRPCRGPAHPGCGTARPSASQTQTGGPARNLLQA